MTVNKTVCLTVAASVMAACATLGADGAASSDAARGWLSWRGPAQNGTSPEVDLPDAVAPDGENHLWSYPARGRGTPVVCDGRVYAMGYDGEGPDLQEIILCLDEDDGSLIWEHRFSDFLSDNIYDRYTITSPVVDPETRNVLFLTSPGLLCCFTRDGEKVWEHSLMTEFGRLTFPNGRTPGPLIEGELAILHVISGHWGAHAPVRDRFLAFDKRTGESVWACAPGVGPIDNPYSYPVFEWRDGRRVLYAGAGCGNVVAVNALDGSPIWRFQLATGGVNSSTVIHGDSLIALHARENVDSSTIGRMVSLKLDGPFAEPGAREAVVRGAETEEWRNELDAFTSSPVLVGDRIYQTTAKGNLCCVDADTGAILWSEHLAPDQIHASPLAADGKLYVPMNNGSFWIIRPSDEGPEVLCEAQLEGNCLGAPAVSGGRIYVHTTEKLYCFGDADGEAPEWPTSLASPPPGAAARLQVIPGDVLLRPGDSIDFRVRSIDAVGQVVSESVDETAWTGLDALGLSLGEDGGIVVSEEARPGVATLSVAAGELSGTMRVRVVPRGAYSEDFEGIALTKPDPNDPEVRFEFPPDQWIGARLKWEVRELDGDKVIAKTLDRTLFQRSWSFLGHPESSNYTMQADIMTDGNRRTMSTAGLVNQRYLFLLKGNHKEIEISSNMERVKETVSFPMKAGTWYTLKTRVDVAEDGSGVVRAKAWPRDGSEPAEWNIEVEHARAHTQGAPGVFGFAPQSRFHVYMDNIIITPND